MIILKKPFNIQELLFKLAKFKKNSNIFKFDDETLFDMETKNSYTIIVRLNSQKNEKEFSSPSNM